MICRASISWRNTGRSQEKYQIQFLPLKRPSKRVQCTDHPYLSTVISHFKDGRLPANPARSVCILLSVIQRVGGAAETLPFQFTHPTALHLELGQIRCLGSAVTTEKTPPSDKQHTESFGSWEAASWGAHHEEWMKACRYLCMGVPDL